MEEVWRPVVGYEGLYEVSNLGRVKSLERTVKCSRGERKSPGKILKCVPDKGYHRVSLSKNGESREFNVHRLVAEAFIPNPYNLPQVDHVIPVTNGGTDNADNLRWVSIKENANNSHSLKNRSDAQLRVSDKKSKSMKGKCVKKLLQYSTENELLNVYSSIKYACEELGYNYKTILSAINKKNKAYGFFWASAK